ncbi:DUF962 domain-containing protein [Flavobacteriaceae bacterium Ap0902]|nr:DUF962 domain-containing protein [Flavobacteriaceae bacterium Ap0902]
MSTIHNLLAEYGESHQNELNKVIHWICVPLIFWSITALLWAVKLFTFQDIEVNLCMVILLLVWLYYIKLSPSLSLGLLLFALACLGVNHWIESNFSTQTLVISAIIIFIISWIFQFYGHKVEGKKPSFLKDLQFLLIGPAWLMHFIYNRLGIKW